MEEATRETKANEDFAMLFACALRDHTFPRAYNDHQFQFLNTTSLHAHHSICKNFGDLTTDDLDGYKADFVLGDFGVSSHQIDEEGRGFSYSKEEVRNGEGGRSATLR